MPRNRVIFNTLGVYAGPSPATGYHFINTNGLPVADDNPSENFNLVFPLNRITEASYGFSMPRTDIKSLGYKGNIARPSLLQPNINLNLTYYQMGLINEARLGFLFNRPSGLSGAPVYGNSNVSPISGFIDRNYSQSIETNIGWPLSTRDDRNLFIVTNDSNLDLNDRSFTEFYKTSGIKVFAFGDCFLTNYSTSAAVGQIPQASVEFVCNNIEYYDFGSGKNIPSINPRDYSLINKTYNIPNNFQGSISRTGITSVILPKDINLNISKSDGTNSFDFPSSLTDIKIQSYEISISLDREPLYDLGYKAPLDRLVNLPCYANLNFTAIVGDNNTGSLLNMVNNDNEYNINIKLDYSPLNIFKGTAIRYDFIGAKFNNVSFSDIIGQNRSATFSFTSEINPRYSNKGFFISGQLGIYSTGATPDLYLGDNFLGSPTVDILLTDSGDYLTIANSQSTPIF